MKKADAVKAAGTQSKLAALLGIRQASVAGWGEYVPMPQAIRLGKMSIGLHFDPDLYAELAEERRRMFRLLALRQHRRPPADGGAA